MVLVILAEMREFWGLCGENSRVKEGRGWPVVGRWGDAPLALGFRRRAEVACSVHVTGKPEWAEGKVVVRGRDAGEEGGREDWERGTGKL